MAIGRYLYATDNGQNCVVLENTAWALAVSLVAAGVGGTKRPIQFKPRHYGFVDAATGKRKEVVFDGTPSIAFGDTVTVGGVAWTCVGYTGEKNPGSIGP